MERVVFTLTIPPCQPCKANRVKRLAARRAPTLGGETWDMCADCAKLLATKPGVEYRDWSLAPQRPVTIVPTTASQPRWDYLQRNGAIHIVAMLEGRFTDVNSATTYAIASARWFKVPVYLDEVEIWTPAAAA